VGGWTLPRVVPGNPTMRLPPLSPAELSEPTEGTEDACLLYLWDGRNISKEGERVPWKLNERQNCPSAGLPVTSSCELASMQSRHCPHVSNTNTKHFCEISSWRSRECFIVAATIYFYAEECKSLK